MTPPPEVYVAVMNLYSRYNLSSDIGTPEEYADCFTADGVLKFDGKIVQQGRDGLVAYKRADQESRGGRYRRHWNGSIHLEQISPTEVRGRCYLQAFSGDPGGPPTLTDTAVYEDTIREVDDDWRFAARSLLFDFRRT